MIHKLSDVHQVLKYDNRPYSECILLFHPFALWHSRNLLYVRQWVGVYHKVRWASFQLG